jgi:hypothetical protein
MSLKREDFLHRIWCYRPFWLSFDTENAQINSLDDPGRSFTWLPFFDVWTGSGVHPAMLRACARAFALSVIPENRRRNSVAADSSPSWSKTAWIAAARNRVHRFSARHNHPHLQERHDLPAERAVSERGPHPNRPPVTPSFLRSDVRMDDCDGAPRCSGDAIRACPRRRGATPGPGAARKGARSRRRLRPCGSHPLTHPSAPASG